MADILISALPEKTSADNTDYLAIDDGTTTYKISVEKYNETGAASAAQSAAAAAQSATDALAAKNAAIQAKDDAQALITSAQTIVSNASDYADSASTSANSANDSANTATAKAAIATDAATQAAAYASNVDNFAKAAKSWAVGGTGTRSGEDTDNAKYYANEAHDSEINAAASESNASTSETNAAASESNASASASSASTNALKAEGYAVGTQNGTPAVSGETYYHDNAKYYKEQAASSETNAGTSETNAAASELAASGSASSAAASATLSESWAVGGTGTRSGEDTNNAKYWSDVAQGAAGGGVSTFNGRYGAVVPAAHDYDADQVDYDGTTSGLQATDVQGAIDEVVGGLGTSAALDVPASGDAATTEVVKGDDSRLTDARTPVSHTHTKSEITDFPTLGTAAAKDSTNAVTQNSTDLVESGAVYTEVSSLNTAIANKADSSKAYQTDDTTETTLASDDVVPFYDTSATAKKKMTVANMIGQTVSNPNLLDNPWFTVNQRGQSSYNRTNIYTVDRWFIGRNTHTLTVENGYVKFKRTSGTSYNPEFAQKLEKLTAGKYTFSVKYRTTSAVTDYGSGFALYLIYNDGSQQTVGPVYLPTANSWEIATLNVELNSDVSDVVVRVQDMHVSLSTAQVGDEIDIACIKLELGSVSTLAMDTAPNYATELLKCQRYFYKTVDTSDGQRSCKEGIAMSNKYISGFSFPVVMRTTPTFTNVGVNKFLTSAVAITATFSVNATQEGVTSIGGGDNPFTIGEAYYIHLEASADL